MHQKKQKRRSYQPQTRTLVTGIIIGLIVAASIYVAITQITKQDQELLAANNTINEQSTEIAAHQVAALATIERNTSQVISTDKFEIQLPTQFAGYNIEAGNYAVAVRDLTQLGGKYQILVPILEVLQDTSIMAIPITAQDSFEFMVLREFSNEVFEGLSVADIQADLPNQLMVDGTFTIDDIQFFQGEAIQRRSPSGVDYFYNFSRDTVRITGFDEEFQSPTVYYFVIDGSTFYTFWFISEETLNWDKLRDFDYTVETMSFNN